jgi:hypothetical protein
MDADKKLMLGAGLAALVVLVIYVKKKGGIAAAAVDAGSTLAFGAAEAVSGFAYGVVDGAVTGTAYTIGDKLGIPRTNMTECEKAKAEGRTWDASFACPAKDFLSYINPFG